MFSGQGAMTFVIDNCGETQHLRHQRAGQSAVRMAGTQEMAHKVRPFTDTTWDDICMPIVHGPEHLPCMISKSSPELWSGLHEIACSLTIQANVFSMQLKVCSSKNTNGQKHQEGGF